MDNKYEIILKLKEMLYEANKVETIENLDILISKVKVFIHKTPELLIEFNKRAEIIKEYQQTKQIKFKNLLRLMRKFVNKTQYLIKPIKDGSIIDFSIILDNPSLCYYYSLKYVMGKNEGNIKQLSSDNSIAEFYSNNIRLFYETNSARTILENNNISNIVTHFIFSKNFQVIRENIDFYVLCAEDYFIMEKALFVKDEMFQKFMLSALKGVLLYLQQYAKNLKFDTNQSLDHIQKAIFYNKLTQKEIEVFELINLTAKEIANKLNIKKDTVDTHIKNIGSKTKIKGIKKLRKLKDSF